MVQRASSSRALGALLLLALAAVVGCQGQGPSIGSETHFLTRCPTDGTCDEGLDCLCGACSRTCDDTAVCADVSPSATCVPVQMRQEHCGNSAVAATCEVACTTDVDCAELEGAYRCDRGFCRANAVDCDRGMTMASDVVLLGDLFLADNGLLSANLEALAQAVGSLPAGQEYRDYSSTLVDPFGEESDLFSQYQIAQTDGPASVVIFDAGGPDALVSCPEPQTQECPSLVNAERGTRDLLAQFSADGVENVLLFFYPDPVDETLVTRFGLLRSMLEGACNESPVPCVFVDLRPTFAGREAELLGPSGLLPTEAGSQAAAEAIWSALEQNCIAQ